MGERATIAVARLVRGATVTFTVGFPILDVLVVLVGLLGLALFASGVREAYIASPAITLGGAGLAVSGVIISIAAGALVFSDIAGAFVDTTAFLWGRYNLSEVLPTIGSWCTGLWASIEEGVADWREILEV